jgi:ABC-2 type transport system ATP-binding protein
MEVRINPGNDAVNTIRNSQWASRLESYTGNSLVFKMHPQQMPELNSWMVQAGMQVLEIRSRHSLEAYFLSLTNDTHAAVRDI